MISGTTATSFTQGSGDEAERNRGREQVGRCPWVTHWTPAIPPESPKEGAAVTDDLTAAYQRKADQMSDHLMMRSHQMECDGESQGGKLEAMPGTKGDGARGPSLISLIEERGEFEITDYRRSDLPGLRAHT
jgi:hypothetical protein